MELSANIVEKPGGLCIELLAKNRRQDKELEKISELLAKALKDGPIKILTARKGNKSERVRVMRIHVGQPFFERRISTGA